MALLVAAASWASSAQAAPECELGTVVGNPLWITTINGFTGSRNGPLRGWSCEVDIHVNLQRNPGDASQNAYSSRQGMAPERSFDMGFRLNVDHLSHRAGDLWTVFQMQFSQGSGSNSWHPVLSFHVTDMAIGGQPSMVLVVEWSTTRLEPTAQFAADQMQLIPLAEGFNSINLTWSRQRRDHGSRVSLSVNDQYFPRLLADSRALMGHPEQVDLGLIDAKMIPQDGAQLYIREIISYQE